MYIRYQFGKGDRKRDAGLTTPEDVRRFDDISYGPDRKYQLLDVYRPKNEEGKLPVIVSVHGGGWVYGTKETYQFYCMSLALRGFAIVNYSYRLAPKHKYPAQLEDANTVIRWILDNADVYGFDTDNIFAVGDSAGGQQLSVYAAMLNDKEYVKYYNIDVPEGFQFNAIALNCGVYHRDYTNKDLSSRLMKDVLPKGWTSKDLEMFNSADKIRPGYPPTYVMSATGDFLKDQVDIIVPVLEKNRIPYVAKIYGDENNRLGHVFHVNMKLEDARICNDEECEFFRSHMK